MKLDIDRCFFAYRRRVVFDALSYTLRAGTTILLGPNGAGKSTLLSLAAAVRYPQSGSITYGNVSSRDRTFRKYVAWMPQNITPIAHLNAREQVAYTGWAKGMSKNDAWERARTALERVGMGSHVKSKASQLSGGELRRVGVAQALVHDAHVILMDEPTAGMDPHQRRVFRNAISQLDDVAVLLSTHDVADLAEEADHVTVLNEGAITYDGATEGFLANAPSGTPPGRRAEAAYTALCVETAR